MELKEVMKSRRETLGLSQQDLAEMARVSLATVKGIERDFFGLLMAMADQDFIGAVNVRGMTDERN